METLIFCDGASKGNPGPGGWGAIVASAEEVLELGGAEKNTTNNRMELRAAIEALRAANRRGKSERVVYTDSSYVINGITKWINGWKKNGWKTKEKNTVINQDLWQSLDIEVGESGPIEWKYVGGHVGVPGNERVDTIASDYAEGKLVRLYVGARADYTVPVEELGADATLLSQKQASNSRSKAKAFSYVSLVEGVVMVHATWKECEERVRGKRARFKKALTKQEEQDLVKQFSIS